MCVGTVMRRLWKAGITACWPYKVPPLNKSISSLDTAGLMDAGAGHYETGFASSSATKAGSACQQPTAVFESRTSIFHEVSDVLYTSKLIHCCRKQMKFRYASISEKARTIKK